MRTFLAVEVSDAVRLQVSKLISKLASDAVGVKWVAPENLHLTLKFFGDISDDDVAKICTAVGRAVAPLPEFDCQCAGVGAFPRPDRPRTIWVGLGEDDHRLTTLQKTVERSLSKLRYPREKRAFHPHVTIGRVRDSRGMRDLSAALLERAEQSFGMMGVSEVTLFASRLRSSGPVYTVLARFPLGVEPNP
jgi:2'-5' RNA ligase